MTDSSQASPAYQPPEPGRVLTPVGTTIRRVPDALDLYDEMRCDACHNYSISTWWIGNPPPQDFLDAKAARHASAHEIATARTPSQNTASQPPEEGSP